MPFFSNCNHVCTFSNSWFACVRVYVWRLSMAFILWQWGLAVVTLILINKCANQDVLMHPYVFCKCLYVRNSSHESRPHKHGSGKQNQRPVDSLEGQSLEYRVSMKIARTALRSRPIPKRSETCCFHPKPHRVLAFVSEHHFGRVWG